MNFGERLKAIREENKLTQQQLAERAGISSRMIQKYESGTSRPRMDATEKLAQALDCPIYDLLGHEGLLVADAQKVGGNSASRDVQKIVDEVSGLFAGGELPQEDKDALMSALTKAYFESKEENKKYTPKKYRN